MSIEKKLLPNEYYDIHDIVKYYDLNSTEDLLYEDEYPSNGEMITFYEPCLDDIKSNKNRIVSEIRARINKEFGDIEVKVWW